MKVVVLTTHTNNTPILYSALCKGYPYRVGARRIHVFVYDRMDSFDTLPETIKDIDPDWVLYIGAIPGYHNGNIPTVTELKSIPYKKVHLCCDGSDGAWWPLLNDYFDHKVFDLQINIDGNQDGPIGQQGLTTIAPIDPGAFPDPSPWSVRNVFAGFGGLVMGGSRAETLRELVAKNLLEYRQRNDDHHSDYVDWISNCKVIWNHSETGGTKSQHVKARVIEAALAGCLVLEKEGSPLDRWFDPGFDYLTWRDTNDVESLLHEIRCNEPAMERMAGRMRRKLLGKYGVDKFWSDVEKMIGVREKECAA